MFRIKSNLSQGVAFPLGTFNESGEEQFLNLPKGEHTVEVEALPENVEATLRSDLYRSQVKLEGGPSRPRPQGPPLTEAEAEAQIAAIRARVVQPEQPEQRTGREPFVDETGSGTSPIKGTPHDPHLRPALTEADALADLRGEPRPDNPSRQPVPSTAQGGHTAPTPLGTGKAAAPVTTPATPEHRSETAQRATEQQRAEKQAEKANEPKKP